MSTWFAIGSSSARFATCGSRPRKPNAPAPKRKSSFNSAGFGAKSSKEAVWQCVEGCGACCKLNKGPSFATPEEIFQSPSDIQLYKSLIGPDGWCVHFDKPTRTCSIYSDRPYFCRVEPGIFRDLYGIEHKKFNKEACSVNLELKLPSLVNVTIDVKAFEDLNKQPGVQMVPAPEELTTPQSAGTLNVIIHLSFYFMLEIIGGSNQCVAPSA
ncbi:hypothetical protein Sjap_001675 [Stephania japonica]|uniref:YkgJ family cysteine cluster protein n=1 Tax=Stephania japonica TaxID=461633 RepID=A0AAP0PTH8_9MAGN